jgi:hypothetical protein
MVFKAERQIETPPKDVLSYIFDSPNYDQDKPVGLIFQYISSMNTVMSFEKSFRRV